MTRVSTAAAEGQAVAEFASDRPDRPMEALPESWRSLTRAFVLKAREHPGREALADSTGASLTYRDTLIRSLALARALAREIPAGERKYVGIFLPPTVPTVVANLAVALLGGVAVNLNYTAGQEVLDSCLDQCRITHVITSARALEKFGLTLNAEPVLLERVRDRITTADKLWAAGLARLAPMAVLEKCVPILREDLREETATVIFTSGSTGQPKGVVLSHRNILSNVRQIRQHVPIQEREVLLGILPLFHSFGYTVTLWTNLCLGMKCVYHVNPLDARIVGQLCQEHGVTLLAASPTFMRHYVKKCTPEQFRTVRFPILGAEKLKPELEREIRERLQIVPLEGYGCTETGPAVAINVPCDMRTRDGRMIPGHRLGTVGMAFPGTAFKTTDPDTGADLPRGAEGVVHVKGPQVMKGYLHQPELTAKVLRDGWYCTGDLGFQDEDGFLTITGRISRFSKIGGEMVPHERVESAIVQAVESADPHVTVVSLPDPRRGERLVVLHTELGAPPEEIHRRLNASPLPKLWIPAPEDFLPVEAIPVLGTGKVDLRRARQIAEERLGRS